MSFLNKFFSSRQDPKSYDKYGDVLKKIMTTKDQRQEAIDALSKLAPEFSIPQLLKRFEIVVDSGLLDNREKDMCMKIIVSHGEKAHAFIREALKTQSRLAWPIKIAEKIFPSEEYLSLLLENLNTSMVVFDESALERNTDILLALKDIHDEKIISRAQDLLASRDEGVKMAALECLESQAVKFSQAKEFILTLKDAPLSDENSRFIGVVNEIARKNSWI